VRWSDVDYARQICYLNYLRFFEICEIELFRAAGMPYREIFERYNIWLPRKQFHCDFHNPAMLDELISVSAYISCLEQSSITLNFEMCRAADNLLLARGRFIIVAADRETFNAVPLPPELVSCLSRFVIADADKI
jgi:acyl-CoA thioester hydrolase